MIEHLGLIYTFGKNIKEHLSWKEDKKVVDRDWLEKSGFKKSMEEQGYRLYWSLLEKIETRKIDGYEVLYETDKIKRIKNRIVLISGRDVIILMGKKENS